MNKYMCEAMVIEGLRDLADYELQRRTWLALSDEVSSFTEMRCYLFDDSGLSRALDKGIVFDEYTDKVIRELHHALSRVNRKLPVEELLEDKAMYEVRRLAREALELIEKNK